MQIIGAFAAAAILFCITAFRSSEDRPVSLIGFDSKGFQYTNVLAKGVAWTGGPFGFSQFQKNINYGNSMGYFMDSFAYWSDIISCEVKICQANVMFNICDYDLVKGVNSPHKLVNNNMLKILITVKGPGQYRLWFKPIYWAINQGNYSNNMNLKKYLIEIQDKHILNGIYGH